MCVGGPQRGTTRTAERDVQGRDLTCSHQDRVQQLHAGVARKLRSPAAREQASAAAERTARARRARGAAIVPSVWIGDETARGGARASGRRIATTAPGIRAIKRCWQANSCVY